MKKGELTTCVNGHIATTATKTTRLEITKYDINTKRTGHYKKNILKRKCNMYKAKSS